MNPFETLSYVQDTLSEPMSILFKRLEAPMIEKWVQDKIAEGTLLWKDPYIQLNRRFEQGNSLQELVTMGVLHAGVLKIFSKKILLDN